MKSTTYRPHRCVRCGVRPRPWRRNWHSVGEAMNHNSFPVPPLHHHLCDLCYSAKQSREAWKTAQAHERRITARVNGILNSTSRFRRRRVKEPTKCFGCDRGLTKNEACVRLIDPGYLINVSICNSCIDTWPRDARWAPPAGRCQQDGHASNGGIRP